MERTQDCPVEIRLLSSRAGPNRTTEHEYRIEGADLETIEGYWAAINAIRERLYHGHP
jgi:hypothetical protein